LTSRVVEAQRFGEVGLQKLGKERNVLRQETHHRLKSGRVYVLDPSKILVPRPDEKVPLKGVLSAFQP
jgi:hypothetical protein